MLIKTYLPKNYLNNLGFYILMDLVRFIKNLENEFLKENNELYLSSRNEFLRKREDFINKKLIELKNEKGCEGLAVSGDNP